MITGNLEVGSQPVPRAKASLVAGGLCLIIFFACTEVLPFAHKLAQIPRRATAHLIVILFPASWVNYSALWLLVPGLISLILACIPFFFKGFRIIPLLLFIAGMSFFAFAVLLPDAKKDGPIWSLFGLAWIGANLWADELDYFYASVVALFLWDMGSGAQALAYGIHALSEPYGNGINPWVVVAIDSIGVIVTCICWIRRMEPKNIAARLKIPLGV